MSGSVMNRITISMNSIDDTRSTIEVNIDDTTTHSTSCTLRDKIKLIVPATLTVVILITQ